MSRQGLRYAKVEKSPRLQRVLELLRDGHPHTTREIIYTADVCAVNTCVAELRANGYEIRCTPVPGKKGIVEYRLIKPEGALFI